MKRIKWLLVAGVVMGFVLDLVMDLVLGVVKRVETGASRLSAARIEAASRVDPRSTRTIYSAGDPGFRAATR